MLKQMSLEKVPAIEATLGFNLSFTPFGLLTVERNVNILILSLFVKYEN